MWTVPNVQGVSGFFHLETDSARSFEFILRPILTIEPFMNRNEYDMT